MDSSEREAIFRALPPAPASSISLVVSCCWRDRPRAHREKRTVGMPALWGVGGFPGSQGPVGHSPPHGVPM